MTAPRRGPGRPPLGPEERRRTVSPRPRPDLWAWLCEYADREGVSQSEALDDAIEALQKIS